jgi:hypothetical protein
LLQGLFFEKIVAQTYKYNLEWDTVAQVYIKADGSKVASWHFKGSDWSSKWSNLPVFNTKIPCSNSQSYQLAIVNPIYEPLKTQSPQWLIEMASTPILSYKKQTAANNTFLVVEVFPLRYNVSTGLVEGLQSFTLQTTATPASQVQLKQMNFAAHSVLANGDWYKVSTSTEGIYKLDKNYWSQAGIDVSTIDPNRLNIWGRENGIIAEDNASSRPDDLSSIPYQWIGDADNSWEDGEYALFYAPGPDKLKTENGYFVHEKNIYADKLYFYISLGQTPATRISSLASLSGSTCSTNQFMAFQYRDKDEKNLIMSGRQWFEKDDFAFTKTKSFNYNFSNRDVTKPIHLKVASAGRYTNPSWLSVSVNGTQQLMHNYHATYDGYENEYAHYIASAVDANSSDQNVQLDLRYSEANGNAWLDYIEVQALCDLKQTKNSFIFSNPFVLSQGGICTYTVNCTNTNQLVWNISNSLSPAIQSGSFSGNNFSFNVDNTSLSRFVVLDISKATDYAAPNYESKISNQDIHGMVQEFPSMLIITPPAFSTVAKKIQALHEPIGQKVLTLNTNKIYEEFAAGRPDPGAIRDMIHCFYSQANGDLNKTPKYVLLLGDGSYDNRNIISDNTAFIPTYQSFNSTEPVYSYGSDDFYALMDAGEGESIENGFQLLDLSVGRLPVKNVEEAEDVYKKLEHYIHGSLGSWRSTMTFVADDENLNLHINQSDGYAENIRLTEPNFNIDKIYLDAYKQEVSSGGARYPDAHDAIVRRLESGTLIMNYTGHGGESGWAHERVFQTDDIDALSNYDKLAIFITATCQFSRYDRPDMVTAGERLILNPKGGAIALLTTVRLVYSSDNQAMNTAVYKNFFDKKQDGRHYTFGEVVQMAKNDNGVGKSENNRKFTLLGDPALPLPFATFEVRNIKLNGKPIANVGDTIHALDRINIEGDITDSNGIVLTNYNGILAPTIFDKAIAVSTLANDPASQFPDGSYVRNFNLQKNAIYKGAASIKSGHFNYSFIVPKDITYYYGPAKWSSYANNTNEDAIGSDFRMIVGGINGHPTLDKQGPKIKAYFNATNFAKNGSTDANPLLLVDLFDSSGINTVGNGIGHELTAVLDDDFSNAFILNDYYQGVLDDYQKGKISYQLNGLKEGKHTLRVKAWDVYNNSSEVLLAFEVKKGTTVAMDHIYNYPNPFTTKTQFLFDHNQAETFLDVRIQIFTVSGKCVKTIHEASVANGYHLDGIDWDGTDDYGDKLARGVYFYKVILRTDNGNKTSAFQKLVIL